MFVSWVSFFFMQDTLMIVLSVKSRLGKLLHAECDIRPVQIVIKDPDRIHLQCRDPSY